MHEKLRQYIEKLFSDAPKTVKMVELKEEMLQNLTDKYQDLLSEGKTEEAAYNIAVASIGDVSGLIHAAQPKAQMDERTASRRAILQAVAIMLYVLCAVPVIVLQSELGLVLLFVMIAAATGILIYNGTMQERYEKTDDTMVEDFKAWKQGNSQLRQAEKAITGCVWMVATIAYFALSFFTGAWHVTWLIFLIAVAVNQMVGGIFMLKMTEDK